jgi:uncharacterized membrane protein
MNRFILILTLTALATTTNAQSEVSFENQILPVLKNRCFECHSAPKADASGRVRKPKGGVQLDRAQGIKESLYGEVIVAGEPEFVALRAHHVARGR